MRNINDKLLTWDIKNQTHHVILKHWLILHAPRLYTQGSHRLEKYLNLEGFLEKSLKIKYALKSTGKSLKCLEKSLNSYIFL